MAKSYALTGSFTATMSVSTEQVTEFERVLRAECRDGNLTAFGKVLYLRPTTDGVEAALSLFAAQALRNSFKESMDGLRDDCSGLISVKNSPLKVEVTAKLPA
ncbi:hypothetical protein BN110_025 [Yersinia phage phiR8-01]|uniref:Uncharacterized protein n=1 Tax=Yersinia phage phiR8-01 TaxID=1206556 RepID=I7KQP4_9CAUD|nr:Gp5.5-like host HNS inhibition [Yersinia phage phiR8-01]CCI88395.2 hypothetical protein BN110_025 [Yersinia phage phiR8-01]